MIARALSGSEAAPQFGALVRYARWSLYVTVAALPLYTVRWHYGPLPTTLLETLIIITVALYVIGRWRDGARRPVSTPFDIPIVVLLAAGAVAIVVAGDHRAALGLYRAYFLEPVALFYVAADVLRNEDDVKPLLLAFAIGSSLFAVLNLIAFYQAFVTHAVRIGGAPNALYGDANYVAMYMEPPLALAAGLLFLGPTSRWRLVGGAWLTLTAAALVLSFSKGAYLALIPFAALILVTIPRWRWVVAAAFVVALAAGTQVPLLMARLATVQSSLNGRAEIFGSAAEVIRQNPLFGSGLGAYSYQFRGAMPAIYPHDIWLTFWVEVGLVGMLAFGVVFVSAQWRGWHLWPHSLGFWRASVWGALAALLLWFFHGLVDSPYWKNDMSVEFWMLVALILVAGRAMRSVPSAAPDAAYVATSPK